MKWTRERPTKWGWYWIMDRWIGLGQTMAFFDGDGHCSIMRENGHHDVLRVSELGDGYAFAGPIPLPEGGDGMTMTVVEEETETPVCSVCARPTGFGDEDKGEPPVNLARCPSPGGMECRAVAQATAPWRRENETLRANCNHLSSENASLASQNESMAMRIESLAEELAKPEDVRLREVLDALDGRFPIFDSAASRVSAALDETEEFIGRAGEASRIVEAARRCLDSIAESMTEHAYQEMASALEAPPRLLEENGCECPCDHHPDERGPDCEVRRACRIGEAAGK